MFKLQRFYAVTSFFAVLVTAVLLTWYYRQVSIQGIVDLTERSNLLLARAAMSPMKPALLEFLAATANFQPNSLSLPLPRELEGAINSMMQDKAIARVKICNHKGVVIFSTRPSQIGGDQSQNQGFISAINGDEESALIYRDTFSHFDGATEEDNLTHTYIPIQAGPAEPIQGVFEIYTDVNRLVLLTERTEFIIMVGATIIMSALYGVLILIVQRAGNIIKMQQRTIRERTGTLEVLSAQMLKSEESHKKRIAYDLHEGLAQTLAAIKLQAESGRSNHKEGDAAAASLDPFIRVLQESVQEVRKIATELRPSILDDIGLLPTINWLCRELGQLHPGIRVEQQISLQEHDIPAPLRIILYRIIASVLDDMAQHIHSGRLHLGLWLDHDNLILLIDNTTTEALNKTAIPLSNIDPQLHPGFARMEELATLSGGKFNASYRSGGGTTLRAAWEV